jgi:hypothetical protein
MCVPLEHHTTQLCNAPEFQWRYVSKHALMTRRHVINILSMLKLSLQTQHHLNHSPLVP